MPVILATCSLNNWALDFQGNYERIKESILQAKSKGATFRVGPELEICGYGCNDHYYESDTFLHSWQVLAKMLSDKSLYDILIDTGMPVLHKNIRYNCRVILLNGKIILIRPKLFLANDGNYRESRWFTPWMKLQQIEEFYLPRMITEITSQKTVPIGDAVLALKDTCLGFEICEELFTPNSTHIHLGLNGVEIISNGSASHHELRKLKKRLDLIQHATEKVGGVYLYSNLQGCDGERVYYDGCSLIAINGKILAQGSQFSLKEVETITATIDLEQVRSYRSSLISRGMQATLETNYPRLQVEFSLSAFPSLDSFRSITKPIIPKIFLPEEEICLGPACWLWDYLTASKMKGFFLPLSGGIDSCSTALIVYSMCELVCKTIDEESDAKVLSKIREIVNESDFRPQSPNELTSRLFYTCYMGTENSSKETQRRAKELSELIGSKHIDCKIDLIIQAIQTFFIQVTGKNPQFRSNGGTNAENLALQNIQARIRMVMSYLFAQLLLWTENHPGSFLVLGSANVDECLRGYFTKYDCSSADLNPIGSISKKDLRSFVAFAKEKFQFSLLQEFLEAQPTAELEPLDGSYVQKDEVDMGMTYDELSIFGRLRKIYKCGPFSMFQKLLSEWTEYDPQVIYEKVQSFFFYHLINRHKMTTLTPSYHAESYSPDDNRFDLRPFLYKNLSWQFDKIKEFITKK